MPRIRGDLTIDCPVGVVFDFVADERNEPLYNPDMVDLELITPPPISNGSRFRATVMSRGRAVPMTIEFTEYVRPTRLASRTLTSGMDITGVLEFAPDPAGTRMRWSWDLRPQGVLRLLGPLVARMGRKQEERIWRRLKQHLESRPA